MKIATWWCLTHEALEMPMEGCCSNAMWLDGRDGDSCKWKAVWISGRRTNG